MLLPKRAAAKGKAVQAAAVALLAIMVTAALAHLEDLPPVRTRLTHTLAGISITRITASPSGDAAATSTRSKAT